MKSETYKQKRNKNTPMIDHDLFDRIESLDLECIKIKLMYAEEGEKWTRSQADEAEKLYKRFLYMVSGTNRRIVPTRPIDKFWHTHILDTRKYADDCQRVFGYFVHHFPYFGMRGDKDKANLHLEFEEACAHYKSLFGEEYTSVGPADCDSCSSSCSGPVGCTSDNKKYGSMTDHDYRPTFALMESLGVEP